MTENSARNSTLDHPVECKNHGVLGWDADLFLYAKHENTAMGRIAATVTHVNGVISGYDPNDPDEQEKI